MGCKQTKVESPSIEFTPSPTAPAVPIYVKSALKNPRGSRIQRRSFLRLRKSSTAKSVNFNEKVRVKVRTPTPKLAEYDATSSRQAFDGDDDSDDDDNEQSSISSQEDVHPETIKSPPLPPEPRTQQNGFRHKNNTVTVAPPSMNNIQEKLPQPTANSMRNSPTENSDIITGNHFIIRRKLPSTVAPQTTNLTDPNPSSRSTTQAVPVLVQRSLPVTNPILIEHPTSFSDSSTSSKTYVFKRRPIRRKTYTKK